MCFFGSNPLKVRTLSKTTALEPTIPKHADKTLTVDKKKYLLEGKIIAWPYLTPFRRTLATIVMACFMVFVISLLSALLGQSGAVPIWLPIVFLVLTFISAGLHSHWDCLIKMDLNTREFTYSVGKNEKPLFSFDDIELIAVDGRRKEQAAGEWWWEYVVAIVTKDGGVVPIVAPEVEELAQTNSNAKALAAFLNLPLIEGKKRSMLKVENDFGRGRLNISFEEKQFEMYDVWPDFRAQYIPVTKKLENKERSIE